MTTISAHQIILYSRVCNYKRHFNPSQENHGNYVIGPLHKMHLSSTYIQEKGRGNLYRRNNHLWYH
jgi:hypothetical protein